MTAFNQAWSLVKAHAFSPTFLDPSHAEAAITAFEEPDEVPLWSQRPKARRLIEDIPDFRQQLRDEGINPNSDEGSWRVSMRARKWMKAQDSPAEHHSVLDTGSLWWEDYGRGEGRPNDQLRVVEDLPLHDDDVQWSEGITEETEHDPWGGWQRKQELARKYADWYEQGHRPAPVRALISADILQQGQDWREREWNRRVKHGHHRGVMADLLGHESIPALTNLTATPDSYHDAYSDEGGFVSDPSRYPRSINRGSLPVLYEAALQELDR